MKQREDYSLVQIVQNEIARPLGQKNKLQIVKNVGEVDTKRYPEARNKILVK